MQLHAGENLHNEFPDAGISFGQFLGFIPSDSLAILSLFAPDFQAGEISDGALDFLGNPLIFTVTFNGGGARITTSNELREVSDVGSNFVVAARFYQ